MLISKLIINADDFGLTREVSHAIIDAHVNGVVTSTTLMGNCEKNVLVDAQEASRKYPDLGIGVHLVLTKGQPILKTHKTIVDGLGKFKYKADQFDESVDVNEVYEEFKAQIERIAQVIEITHFDSHHHVHLDPLFQSVSKRLCKEFKIPMRWNKAKKFQYVYCSHGFYDETATLQGLQEILRKHHGLVDVMVHPGYEDDPFLDEISAYTSTRYEEYKVLTSQALKDFLVEHNIELVNYRFVKKTP
ncbi:hypothetical protein AOC36_03245 [Erysipelothrix larvae]|uniref:Carbohydrate deacetylase n=1 Tax=Erysipelothrix larvae TaxID=1514105 RepID=A0A109UGS3_9FIRM|nr:hypothetical protein AOC36_03245 [Erysipelothrix larvae]